MKNKRFLFLDSDTLKMIAILTMLIDHIAAACIWPALSLLGAEQYESWYGIYRILRNIGRTAFPIFAFLLVEGFFHTHSRKKYIGRLVLFTVLSEIPYNMAFHGTLLYSNDQNVFWTLSIGFFVIWGLEELYKRYETGWKLIKKNGMWENTNGVVNGKGKAYYQMMTCFLAVMLILAGWLVATLLRTDYKGYGILLIVLFYFGKHAKVWPVLTCIGGYLLFLWEPYCLGGFLLILFYNGTRKPRGKGFQYFFYLFYPVHLLILGLIRVVFLVG